MGHTRLGVELQRSESFGPCLGHLLRMEREQVVGEGVGEAEEQQASDQQEPAVTK